jgi:hypothetical protein
VPKWPHMSLSVPAAQDGDSAGIECSAMDNTDEAYIDDSSSAVAAAPAVALGPPASASKASAPPPTGKNDGHRSTAHEESDSHASKRSKTGKGMPEPPEGRHGAVRRGLLDWDVDSIRI